MKKILLLLLFTCQGIAVSAQNPRDREEIFTILSRQQSDWNQGNITSFMVGYWESDSLVFVGSKGLTYGYRNIYENYRQRYPDRAAMGQLKFEIKAFEFLCADLARMIGRFHLTRPEKGDAEGHFTLIWRKINHKWVIISDHSG